MEDKLVELILSLSAEQKALIVQSLNETQLTRAEWVQLLRTLALSL